MTKTTSTKAKLHKVDGHLMTVEEGCKIYAKVLNDIRTKMRIDKCNLEDAIGSHAIIKHRLWILAFNAFPANPGYREFKTK